MLRNGASQGDDGGESGPDSSGPALSAFSTTVRTEWWPIWAPHHTPQVALVWKNLDGLGLNIEQLAFDMTVPEFAKVIAQDLADARTLNVTKTPEFFVNGKPLPSFGYEQLKRLVDDALGGAGRR